VGIDEWGLQFQHMSTSKTLSARHLVIVHVEHMDKELERLRAESLLQDGRIPMKLKGLPLDLDVYETSEVLTNKHFRDFEMCEFERVYLPESMRPFTDLVPTGTRAFIADDNRGAVSTLPYL
jgi:hypothetical protein